MFGIRKVWVWRSHQAYHSSYGHSGISEFQGKKLTQILVIFNPKNAGHYCQKVAPESIWITVFRVCFWRDKMEIRHWMHCRTLKRVRLLCSRRRILGIQPCCQAIRGLLFVLRFLLEKISQWTSSRWKIIEGSQLQWANILSQEPTVQEVQHILPRVDSKIERFKYQDQPKSS